MLYIYILWGICKVCCGQIESQKWATPMLWFAHSLKWMDKMLPFVVYLNGLHIPFLHAFSASYYILKDLILDYSILFFKNEIKCIKCMLKQDVWQLGFKALKRLNVYPSQWIREWKWINERKNNGDIFCYANICDAGLIWIKFMT